MFALAAVIVGLAPGCGDHAAKSERICTAAGAISSVDLHGGSLPMKALALTFDDGPGLRTRELSSYLKAQGIAAGFFVNGKMVGPDASVLQQVVDDGHFLANHTQTHRSLTGRVTGGAPLSAAEVVWEITQTDALIAPLVNGRFLFRAPFGDFDAQTGADIDASPMKKYVGPVNWEIGDHMGPAQAADWDCWTQGADGAVLTPEQCGALYLEEIESVGHGIVLMHDPYFIDDDPAKGGTVDMVKSIVPVLKARGYTFVRIDHVPDLAALLPTEPAPVDAGAEGTPHADAAPPGTMPGASRDAGPDAPPSGPRAVDAGAPADPCAPTRATSR
jgi:peptidoglycan/xylan/chitin deacetylase (PgdA/CDA1 family)